MSSIHTPICDQLGIDYPIFSVGFGESATPELAAAVSGAGGCGVLGGCPPDEIRRRIAELRSLTDRPFGQNVIIANHDSLDIDEEGQQYDRERVQAALDERVPILVLFWGDPSYFVREAHEAGTKVFIQTGTVEEAVHAAEAGVDAVIAQGIEAGGHVRASESLWTILPRVVKAIAPLPVIASGGIGDGAGIARALRLGAQGVSLGTRFVACHEAWIHPAYKRKVVESTAADTVLVDDLFDVGWPNAPHRVLRNRIVAEWEAAGQPPSGARPNQDVPIGVRRRPWGVVESWPRYAPGMIPPDFESDPEYGPMWAGTSVSSVNDIKTAAQIVRDLVRESKAALARS
jgi:NAD(P)H-dependent flavin oxidoreductase YrpB (nitropropane dioxygenase family)